MSPVEGGGLVFIKQAAAQSGLHPQTIRLYEEAGLVCPARSSGGTRLYSSEDIDRLQRVYVLSSELGMDLKGIEAFFKLEDRLRRSERRLEKERIKRLRSEALLKQEIDRLINLVYSDTMLPARIAVKRPR